MCFQVADKLVEQGFAYPCFDSKEDREEQRAKVRSTLVLACICKTPSDPMCRGSANSKKQLDKHKCIVAFGVMPILR